MAEERKVVLLERPLTARSVVLSLLLGRRPPRARVGLLVRWCAEFGVSENAARVALSRMVDRGELAAEEGTYRLAGRLELRQREQEVALAPPEARWAGGWHVVVLGGGPRTAAGRAAQREALRTGHFGQRREGVWVRPDNLPVPRALLDDTTVSLWTATPVGERAADLAESVFGLRAMAERGVGLLGELERATERLGPEGLAHPFVVGAAVLQHLRRDPLLPAALVPAGWPGPALRAAYRRYEERFSAAVADWYRRA